MVFSWDIAERLQCSKKEKQSAAAVIDVIVNTAEKARREGLLALEDDIDEYRNPLLKMGMQLVIEGTDPEVIREILEIRILADNKKGGPLIEQLISYRGCLGVQAGDNPRILADYLFAFFGEDGDSIKSDYLRDSVARKEEEMVKRFEEADTYYSKSAEDLAPLTGYSDRAIQKILREIDIQDLSVILQGGNSNIRKKFFSNMSKKAVVLTVEQTEYSPAAEVDVLDSTAKLWSIIGKLKDQGEI